MLLKNIATGNSIDDQELDYFIRLKSKVPYVDEGWIYDNVCPEKLERRVVQNLNKKGKKNWLFKSKYLRKLEKYSITKCEISELDRIETYLLPSGNLILEIFFKIIIGRKIKTKKRNKNKGVDKDIYPILTVEMVITSSKIIEKLVGLSLSSRIKAQD